MPRNRLRILSIIGTGALVTGIGNFMVFMYFYRILCVEHVAEYWRTVHGGRMLDEIRLSCVWCG